MTTGPESGAERRFVPNVLPWVVAAAALAVYLLTLNHWVSLISLQQVARTAGWLWQPELITPAYHVVTYPFHWLSPKWIPLALNLFSAVCGVLTLALLARSVALLPHDRTDEQRRREHSEFSTLSIPLAWVPPLLAVTCCGLQLTFWEHSTNGTIETFDLLLGAYVIRALLEYRIDERESWLYRAAFVYGAGMTNNWAMVGFFPVFVAALVWIRGVSFFNLRFLGWLSLCGLGGLLLYLVLPLAASLSATEPTSFWLALKANLTLEKRTLFLFPKNVLGLLALTSLLPVFVMAIRWASYFGDTSRLGTALTTLLFHVVHAVLLAVCIWVAFDPPFSPRHYGLAFPFYYLGALGVGYFSGYFLLVFGDRPSQLPFALMWLRHVNRLVTVSVLALLIVVPAGLIYRNLPSIHATNGTILPQYAASLAEGLPAQGGILLSDDSYHLLIMQSWLAQAGREKDFLLLNTQSLPDPAYHRYLREKHPQKWEPTADAKRTKSFDQSALIQLILKLAEHSEIYYLHPGFGYYFESFYQEPRRLVYGLKRYAPDTLLPPPPAPQLIAENEAFWAKAADQILNPVLAATEPPISAKPAGIVEKLFRRAHVSFEQNAQTMFVGTLYSLALNYWGVEMQKRGDLEKAAGHFELAQELNPDNVAARNNLEYNKTLRAGQQAVVQRPKSVEDWFGKFRNWNQVLWQNGPYDEPSLCSAQGYTLLQARLYRQAAQLFDRVRTLSSEDLPSRLALARLYLLAKLPDNALALAKEIRDQPGRFALSTTNNANLVSIEAAAHFTKGETNRAEEVLRATVDQAPNDERVLTMATAVYTAYKDYPNAVATVGRLLKVAPGDERVLAMAAGVYTRSEDFTNALTTLNRLVKLAPDDPDTLMNKGTVCVQLNDYDEAIRTLTHLLTLQTNNYIAMFNRAIAELRGDQLDAAKKDYETLQAVFPAEYRIYYGLGDIAYRRKETNAAIKYCEAYLTNALPNTEESKLVSTRLKELKGEKP